MADANIISSSEMRFLIMVKEWSRFNMSVIEDISSELKVSILFEKVDD